MDNINKPELVLTAEGALYHINLKPGDLARNIILVGDPGRTAMVSDMFDNIELKKQNREILTVSGTYKGKPVSVISTGMGTDNIEIVVNEIDALFNIDLESGMEKPECTSLNLIRIGTSGALQSDIPVHNSFLVSEYGIGLDGLAYFYKNHRDYFDKEMTDDFIKELKWLDNLPNPYAVKASEFLVEVFGGEWRKGITLTAPGFYAPQGRKLRLDISDNEFLKKLKEYNYKGEKITNFEMETSALYFLSSMLGHNALTVCNIIANRITGMFDPDYKTSMKTLIKRVLDRITEL